MSVPVNGQVSLVYMENTLTSSDTFHPLKRFFTDEF